MARIAFLGLGAMGARMAARLVQAGHRVTVWNRSGGRASTLIANGAATASTPREAVGDCELAIAMLRDDEASLSVWRDPDIGALRGMKPGSIAVESSTLTTGLVRELSRHAHDGGVAFLDAPVLGSRPQAEAGALIHLVGGEAESLARAEPVLKCLSAAIHHVGPSGSGAALKLASNALFGVQVAALAELIGLLGAEGVDLAHAIEILGMTPVCSLAAKGAAASMLARSFAPMFPVELVEKDLSYVQLAAKAHAADVPMADATRKVMAKAVAQGFGADNLTGILRLYA